MGHFGPESWVIFKWILHFEKVLTSRASKSLIDPFHPYDPVEGNIELGKAPGFRFGITNEILRQNMLVVGQSGSGKTNLFVLFKSFSDFVLGLADLSVITVDPFRYLVIG